MRCRGVGEDGGVDGGGVRGGGGCYVVEVSPFSDPGCGGLFGT